MQKQLFKNVLMSMQKGLLRFNFKLKALYYFFEFLLQQRDFFMCLKRYFFVFIVTVGTQLCSGSSVDRWVIESFFNKQDVPVDSVELFCKPARTR